MVLVLTMEGKMVRIIFALILVVVPGLALAEDCVVLEGEVYCPDGGSGATLSKCTQVGPYIYCN